MGCSALKESGGGPREAKGRIGRWGKQEKFGLDPVIK